MSTEPDSPNIFVDVHTLGLDLASMSHDMTAFGDKPAVTAAARENVQGRAVAYMEAARRVQTLLNRYKIELDLSKPKTIVTKPGQLF